MECGASPAQTRGFWLALRMKGEFLGEIVGAARVCAARGGGALSGRAAGLPLVDLVGTGGDGTAASSLHTPPWWWPERGAVAKHATGGVQPRGQRDLMAALGVPLA